MKAAPQRPETTPVPPSPFPAIMLDFDTAQTRLSQAGQCRQAVHPCALHDALGRVLAQDVVATYNLPPADNSAMDGYALRRADWQTGQALPVQAHSYAGQMPPALLPGHAIRLFTGSVLPAGADTVVMQENCSEADNAVIIHTPPALGENVRKQGQDMCAGHVILTRGTRITPAHVACLAAQGLAQVPVFAPLRVGILTNGDELLNPGQPLGAAQTYNSNGHTLAALCAQLGVEVAHQIHCQDQPEALTKALATLKADCDLVLTVGGVSVGDKDFVRPALEAAGARLDLWKVRMKPGKPVALSRLDETVVVCLPGNPVSSYAVFTLLVTPLIRRLQGRCDVLPANQTGRLDCSDLVYKDSRAEFLRVRANTDAQGILRLQPYARQGSDIISSLAYADGLARIPPDTPTGDGETVRYYAWRDWLF